MRAWLRPSRGPPATSLKLSTIPTPTITHDSTDILIRVAYSALQYSSEFMLRTLPAIPGLPPRIPELEWSGVVVAAGSRAPAELREIGARVAAFHAIPNFALYGYGCLAEYVKVPASQVVRLSGDFDLVAAGGISGAGSTALKMMHAAGVSQGDKVLVNGASSSVGSVMVQMCKAKGITVLGTASGGNEELVRGLGVDEFIDYTARPLPEYLSDKHSTQPFDAILDCAGIQALYTHSPAYLKPSGAVVNVGSFEGFLATFSNWFLNAWRPTWLGGIPRRYIMFSTPPSTDATAITARLIDEGKVRMLIDSVWEIEDVVKAYARIATKRARGKVIVKVGKDGRGC
ncbi:zinc ion binding [Saxophila tyrrhenica]|uniref:Zinc ion binding n=1 Tax=Saxophila tyrrhenica TaxID=1690608 RepID=A0AAV9P1V9_9PEZI|nr:zinc ion binding [Saxophila tyrrhenica]